MPAGIGDTVDQVGLHIRQPTGKHRVVEALRHRQILRGGVVSLVVQSDFVGEFSLKTRGHLQTRTPLDFGVSRFDLDSQPLGSGGVRVDGRRSTVRGAFSRKRQSNTASAQGHQGGEAGCQRPQLTTKRGHLIPTSPTTMLQGLPDEGLLQIMQAVLWKLRVLVHGRQQAGVEGRVFAFNLRRDRAQIEPLVTARTDQQPRPEQRGRRQTSQGPGGRPAARVLPVPEDRPSRRQQAPGDGGLPEAFEAPDPRGDRLQRELDARIGHGIILSMQGEGCPVWACWPPRFPASTGRARR